MPRETIAEVPSGATSQSLAETKATGVDDGDQSSRRGWPMISSLLGERPVVDEGERLIPSLVPRRAEGEHRGAPDGPGDAHVAADLERVHLGGLSGRRLGRRRRRASGRRSSASRAGGQSGSARHWPRARQDRVPGRSMRAKTKTGGSRSTLASPPSHRCHQSDHHRHEVDPRSRHRQPRTHVAPWAEEQPLRAPSRSNPGTPCCGSRRRVPRSRGSRLRSIVVEADRAVAPEVVLVLVLEPPQLPGLVRLDPAEPLLAPAVPVDHGTGGSAIIATMYAG